MSPVSALSHLECARCGGRHEADRLQDYCHDCPGPLLPRYDLGASALGTWPGVLEDRAFGLWRYAELLPVRRPECRVDLGEGGTPLLSLPRLGREIGLESLRVKDEGLNPTGSFKARGLCVAVSRALELGVRRLSIPTAGNAGSALAAYCARAGLEAVVYYPVDTPPEYRREYRDLGARATEVDGTIADAGARMAEEAEEDWFPVSTLKEPYRLEGKKTMGLELAEQLDWSLPDAIIYPTGGGTGLLGMWKAFEELEAIGLIGARRPRMIAVQAEGCAPIVSAFHAGEDSAEPWQDARTLANGLRVPAAFADREILAVLRDSGGTALTVSDEEMLGTLRRLARLEGIYAAPEAAATLAAARRLATDGSLEAGERVVAFLTGNAYKYLSSLH